MNSLKHSNIKTTVLGLVALLAPLSSCFLTSCNEDFSTGATYNKYDGTATVLTVTKDGQQVNSLDLTMGETTNILSIDADGAWTASIPAADTTWLHLTPHAGNGWAVGDATATNLKSHVKLVADYNDSGDRSSTLTVTAGSLTQQIAINQKGISGGTGDPIENVWQMLKKWKAGYNLGNTLESNHNRQGNESWFKPSGPGDWQTYETTWGQSLTTQEMIDDITAKGFNVIRVPVTWFPHVDADWTAGSNDWTINADWMNRVQQVVDMVISTGSYCILNVMHDTGARGADRTDHHAWLNTDASKYEQNTVIYQNLWKQIATRFRDYDEHLIFESFNEILDASSSWTAPADNSKADYTTINKLQQDFVNTVRATGGNNAYRNLAVTTYSATGNNKVPLQFFEKPADTVDNHIYLSIHSYDPYNFCASNMGKNNGIEYDYNQYVFDEDCQAMVNQVISNVSTRAAQCGMPFVFGEFGAIDEGKEMNERVKYATYVATKLKEQKTTGLWWMGLYSRSNDAKNASIFRTWYEDRIANALVSVLNGQ